MQAQKETKPPVPTATVSHVLLCRVWRKNNARHIRTPTSCSALSCVAPVVGSLEQENNAQHTQQQHMTFGKQQHMYGAEG